MSCFFQKGYGGLLCVILKERFMEEFQPDSGAGEKISWHGKPPDYQSTFTGNTDDCFRVGIGITKKKMRLYSDFYKADVILASPLGLRMIVGDEGERDFLASVEVLILDQTDVMFMQNFQHVISVMDALHQKPREQHGTDYSRVRLWALDDSSKFYRQTLVFSAVLLPEFRLFFTGTAKDCRNYSGFVEVSGALFPKFGYLSKIQAPVSHSFQRITTSDWAGDPDDRFKYFLHKILPPCIDGGMSHTLIFVPDYADFVRIRNYFKRKSVSFVQLSEYSSNKKVSRARDLFFHGKKRFLLLSERFHFYRRYRIRGIQNLIFYQPPTYGVFFEELCEMAGESPEGISPTATTIFSQFDHFRLSALVGTDKSREVIRAHGKVPSTPSTSSFYVSVATDYF